MSTLTADAVTTQPGGGLVASRALPQHGGYVTNVAAATADPVAFTLQPLPQGGAANKFTDNGGAVIQIPRVQLIYWGSAWAANPPPTPTSAAVTAAVQAMLSGPYMTGLAQYRQIGRGHLLGATVVTSSNPPNPFSDSNVASFINGLIAAGTIPGLDAARQNLYLVIMPQGVNNTNSGFIGEHTYYTDGAGNRVHFGWITNNGTLNYVTDVLSHELVESATDPEGSAILGVAGTCSGGGWCEIGDICEGTSSNLHGVEVQSFWSNNDGKCIVPDWPNVVYPYSGTQWTYTLAPNQTVNFFTFNWPEYLFMVWEVVPTTIGSTEQITWSVAIQRASGAYNTFWITVTNLTGAPVGIEGRYSVLGVA
jgi:hypothetical protein